MLAIITYLFILILFGIIICFKGKQLYFPIIMLEAFLTTELISVLSIGFNLKGLLIGTGLGVIMAILARFVYKLGIFMCGVIAGALVGRLITGVLPQALADYSWILIVLVALVGGICAVHWSDLFISISTASNGAVKISTGVCFLAFHFTQLDQFVYADGAFSTITHLSKFLRTDFITQNWLAITVVSVIIFVMGFLFQQHESVNGRRNAHRKTLEDH